MSFPARLHVLLASEAPLAVVFRRGPARMVCSVGWNRQTDEFQVGQWLMGRIYERRADISPDGRHMIYFAMNAKWTSESQGSWTAVSRAPWLKAMVFLPWGSCWLGGGLFTSNTTYWVNGGGCGAPSADTSKLSQDREFRAEGSYGGECPSVYYRRLQRTGWTLRENFTAGATGELTIFEKPLPLGWTLRKYAHADVQHPQGTGCYWDEHELEQPARGLRIVCKQWEWADRDGDTLVWAEKGCLHRAELLGDALGQPRVLFDFNPLRFQPIEAPY